MYYSKDIKFSTYITQFHPYYLLQETYDKKFDKVPYTDEIRKAKLALRFLYQNDGSAKYIVKALTDCNPLTVYPEFELIITHIVAAHADREKQKATWKRQ